MDRQKDKPGRREVAPRDRPVDMSMDPSPPSRNGKESGNAPPASSQNADDVKSDWAQPSQPENSTQPADQGKDVPAPEAWGTGKKGAAKGPFYKRPVLMAVLLVLVVGAGVGTILWWLHARHFEKTDDAFIQADITRVAPQVSGRVERVLVADNQEVHDGDLLLEIRPIDFQVKLQQAQAAQAEMEAKLAQAAAQESVAAANVQQGKAEVAASEATANQASSDLQRYQSLSAEAVSRQQLDQAQATAKNTAAQLDAAKRKLNATEAQAKAATTETHAASASVESAQSQVQQARVQLEYTKVYAHVDGWITSKSVSVGDYVQPGQQVLAIVPREVWVIANFKETQLDRMHPGQPVTLVVDAYPGREFHGTVQSIQAGSGSAFSLLPPENATGNYVKIVQRMPVKITFNSDTPPNPPGEQQHIVPGMSVVPSVKVR